MITSDLIKDIVDIKVNYSSKMFYLWCLLKFGANNWFNYNDCIDYGKCKRQLQRYTSELESKKMIKKCRTKGIMIL